MHIKPPTARTNQGWSHCRGSTRNRRHKFPSRGKGSPPVGKRSARPVQRVEETLGAETGAVAPAAGPPRRRAGPAPGHGRLHRRRAHGRGVRDRRGLRHLQGRPPPRRRRAEAPLWPPLPLRLHRAVAGDAQLLPRLPLLPPVHRPRGGGTLGAGSAAHADHYPVYYQPPLPCPRCQWCGGSGCDVPDPARPGHDWGRRCWTRE